MRVLVLGGGYAGLSVARRLEQRLDPGGVELVLVDEDGTHLLQNELHRVLRRPSLAEHVALDLEELLEWATVRTDTVVGIEPPAHPDPDATGTVELDAGEELEYDVCATALGATASLAVPGVDGVGLPLKRLDHALAIHEAARPALTDPEGQVVVGGAGLSGIQAAGELAALGAEVTAERRRSSGTVTILEQAERVAPAFDEQFQAAVHAQLEDRGVEVRTGATVERVTDDAIELADGTQIDQDILVWTGGITGQDALDGDRPQVDATLRLAPRTFGLGDAVRIVDQDGEPVPATAQAAVASAETVAANVERVLEHEGPFAPRLERFRFDSPGWVVSVGNGAVAQVGPSVVTGPAAVAMKASVGAGYLGSTGSLGAAVDLVHEELGLVASGR